MPTGNPWPSPGQPRLSALAIVAGGAAALLAVLVAALLAGEGAYAHIMPLVTVAIGGGVLALVLWRPQRRP